MKRKVRVGVIFGGKSAEHEVSLQSAKNVIEAIDKEKYEVVPIAIGKEGKWHIGVSYDALVASDNSKLAKLNPSDVTLALVPGQEQRFVALSSPVEVGPLDVVFPVLHGPYGEDGTIQGFLKLADIPFVGAGVAGSAVGMDKELAKRLLREASIPIARFLVVPLSMRSKVSFSNVAARLGTPVFVKPANLGSSVGVSKVKSKEEFGPAVAHAFEFDRKILIEEFIQGREIECAVLGNDTPIASLPGEVIPRHEFYSYDAKYLDENGAALEIPVKLPEETVRRVQELAVKAFKALSCEGMGRVDFFLKENGELLVNEINTIPGFTKISMYPKLWEASGIPYTELIDRLIQLALERFEEEKKLKTSFTQS